MSLVLILAQVDLTRKPANINLSGQIDLSINGSGHTIASLPLPARCAAFSIPRRDAAARVVARSTGSAAGRETILRTVPAVERCARPMPWSAPCPAPVSLDCRLSFSSFSIFELRFSSSGVWLPGSGYCPRPQLRGMPHRRPAAFHRAGAVGADRFPAPAISPRSRNRSVESPNQTLHTNSRDRWPSGVRCELEAWWSSRLSVSYLLAGAEGYQGE